MARPTPLSGFPEFSPAERIAEQRVLDTLRATFESWGFASLQTRAVEPMGQLLRKGEIDKEVYVLRRLHADPDEEQDAGPHPRPALRPHRAVRALRAGEQRASSSSRSSATRSSRSGGGSGRRRAATASSPRPTSTSSATASCRSTRTSRSPR